MVTAESTDNGHLLTKSAQSEIVLTQHEKPDWLTYTNSFAQIVPGKGAHYNICILDMNIDIESGMCSVMVNDKTGQVTKSDACSYCYAMRLFKNNSPYKAKKVRESVFKRLKEKIPEFSVLRIGKNFECGSKNTRSELYEVLELCIKYQVRPIVTSKILEYDKELSYLIKQANGVLHISIGIDILETGAVKKGYPNTERYKIAKKYKKDGIVCAVRVTEDITTAMPKLVRKIHNDGFPILLTPLYYNNKKTFEIRRKDITWDYAKESGTFKYEKGALHPILIHPDWKTVKERCGLIKGRMHCNNCNLGKVIFSPEVGSNKKLYHKKLIEYGWN